MKMEPTVSSETSAIRTQTTGNYPKRNKLHLEHGESLKTRTKELYNSDVGGVWRDRHENMDKVYYMVISVSQVLVVALFRVE